MCNCKGTEVVIGLVILVFALWPTLLSAMAVKWISIVAAVILILHGLKCPNMSECAPMAKKPMRKKAAKKKKKR
ncbi:hypothetical protein GOV13_04005 [Candidatus Pacearchaeota archaeon]|nr:hypothetical protein [Candidatus Pacearchaeota archaeon]